MRITGPDLDGLMWVHFHGTDTGKRGALSAHKDLIVGQAMLEVKEIQEKAPEEQAAAIEACADHIAKAVEKKYGTTVCYDARAVIIEAMKEFAI